jgi:hypothetical protein
VSRGRNSGYRRSEHAIEHVRDDRLVSGAQDANWHALPDAVATTICWRAATTARIPASRPMAIARSMRAAVSVSIRRAAPTAARSR